MAKGRGKRKRETCKEKETEDWCFDCKDGGQLVICDHKNCGKVYHPDCIGKDDCSLESESSWICDWHYCYNCKKSPKFYCLGCPNAVCKKCFGASKFAIVSKGKGLCRDCLELVMIVEKNLEQDSEGNKISLDDRETYEGLFKEYWDIIKVKEGLTGDEVCAAHAKYQKGKNLVHQREFNENEEDDDSTSYESDIDDACDHKPGNKRKRSNVQEFIGWGSKPLIRFLTSIGEDTIEPSTQFSVNSLIHEYIVKKNLHHPQNKRMFIPDQKLFPIFRKKVVPINEIFVLLEAHFVRNWENRVKEKNDNAKLNNSIDKHLSGQTTCKKGRPSILIGKPLLKKGDFILKPSCLASISVENIKLIYLRQSLVQELSKQTGSFEDKVVGTFVRIKTDPKDHTQRNYHQLVQVTGVKKSLMSGEMMDGFYFQVSFTPEAIPISKLSDMDFTKEECEDLQQKVKDGFLQKLTVVELEKKARSLHEDVTKHWIAWRLAYLQNQIDYMNLRGRQREKIAYLDEKEELEQPWKQEKLLGRMPSISPELVEARYDPEEQGLECIGSPQSVLQLDSDCPVLSTKR